jgi:hypothetical protein
MLIGLTKDDTNELLPIARNWTNAPELISKNQNISDSYYDQAEKAYKIKLTKTSEDIDFTILANEESPIVNPAIIIENWGGSDIIFKIEEEQMERGSDLRYGYSYGLNTTDLIIWIRMESEETMNFIIENADLLDQ